MPDCKSCGGWMASSYSLHKCKPKFTVSLEWSDEECDPFGLMTIHARDGRAAAEACAEAFDERDHYIAGGRTVDAFVTAEDGTLTTYEVNGRISADYSARPKTKKPARGAAERCV